MLNRWSERFLNILSWNIGMSGQLFFNSNFCCFSDLPKNFFSALSELITLPSILQTLIISTLLLTKICWAFFKKLFFSNDVALGKMITESRTMFSMSQKAFLSYEEIRQPSSACHIWTVMQPSRILIKGIIAVPYIDIARGSTWVVPSWENNVCLLMTKFDDSRYELH